METVGDAYIAGQVEKNARPVWGKKTGGNEGSNFILVTCNTYKVGS